MVGKLLLVLLIFSIFFGGIVLTYIGYDIGYGQGYAFVALGGVAEVAAFVLLMVNFEEFFY